MKEDMKIRGFTLNRSSCETLYFNTMRELVMDFCKGIESKRRVEYNQIRRKEDGVVITVGTKKDYRVVYDKRVLRGDSSTVPYGY
ncbi:MAG: hypothetical protein GY820_29680 [Gammaproteobacteria bacterium]|nr:hypothetical protein [Gammaproteobacteria bacterium]